MKRTLLLSIAFLSFALSYNFAFEAIQLTDEDVLNNPSIAFGDTLNPEVSGARCKTYPGDAEWPSEGQWQDFNATLGGALIKPTPIPAPCYAGPQYDALSCARIQQQWVNSSIQ